MLEQKAMNRVSRSQPETRLSDIFVIINSAEVQHFLQE